ncbi:MAG: hypothetical protein ACQEQ7_06670 [Thermodesulfobacteriota bacterium]
MVSKSKETRVEQKAFWEKKLHQRLSALEEKGVSPEKKAKDTTVRSLRAKLRETDKRLGVITEGEKKVEEMARLKAEKLAVPKQGKPKKGKKAKTEEPPAESKRQKKKKKKKEGNKETK